MIKCLKRFRFRWPLCIKHLNKGLSHSGFALAQKNISDVDYECVDFQFHNFTVFVINLHHFYDQYVLVFFNIRSRLRKVNCIKKRPLMSLLSFGKIGAQEIIISEYTVWKRFHYRRQINLMF